MSGEDMLKKQTNVTSLSVDFTGRRYTAVNGDAKVLMLHFDEDPTAVAQAALVAIHDCLSNDGDQYDGTCNMISAALKMLMEASDDER